MLVEPEPITEYVRNSASDEMVSICKRYQYVNFTLTGPNGRKESAIYFELVRLRERMISYLINHTL